MMKRILKIRTIKNEEDPENQDDKKEKAANEYNSRDDEQKKNSDAGIPKRPVGGQPGHPGSTLSEADVQQLIESLKESGVEPDIVHWGDNVTGKYKDRFFIVLIFRILFIICFSGRSTTGSVNGSG